MPLQLPPVGFVGRWSFTCCCVCVCGSSSDTRNYDTMYDQTDTTDNADAGKPETMDFELNMVRV